MHGFPKLKQQYYGAKASGLFLDRTKRPHLMSSYTLRITRHSKTHAYICAYGYQQEGRIHREADGIDFCTGPVRRHTVQIPTMLSAEGDRRGRCAVDALSMRETGLRLGEN